MTNICKYCGETIRANRVTLMACTALSVLKKIGEMHLSIFKKRRNMNSRKMNG